MATRVHRNKKNKNTHFLKKQKKNSKKKKLKGLPPCSFSAVEK
jgi:hypothetical protein